MANSTLKPQGPDLAKASRRSPGVEGVEVSRKSITRPRVLVVEDDAINLSLLQRALAKCGYEVFTATDGNSAQEAVARIGVETLDCVVTDYRMPGQNGLDLLAWIRQQDPCLSTIIITAEEERMLIAESLRGGAFDFLDKPVDSDKLRSAVEQAIRESLRQRHLTKSESAVKELGRAQEWMLGVGSTGHAVNAEVCFYPKHEAGGDFFSHFRPKPHQLFCLLTDVSGHDVQAAFISAYFQGVVRGMLEETAGVEKIFQTFNRILSQEWNEGDRGDAKSATISASVAACGVAIDSTARTATVLSHGTAAPVYCEPDGRAVFLGNNGGFPLGWFDGLSQRSFVQDIAAGGFLCLWTDGLDDLADKMGVSPLSVALALERAKARKQKPAEMRDASDDILFANIRLPFNLPSAKVFRPLILEAYRGDRSDEIDQFQSFWKRSLELAAPGLPEATLHDVLLASRETVLNALHHGCRDCATMNAGFQVAYCQSSRTLRVRVCDPGPGHQFDYDEHEQKLDRELPEAHRGLILLKHLATKLEIERNGATVIMDFTWT